MPELAKLAEVVALDARRAKAGLDGMRLALPDALTHGVRHLATEAPELAASLACVAGTCRGPNRSRLGTEQALAVTEPTVSVTGEG